MQFGITSYPDVSKIKMPASRLPEIAGPHKKFAEMVRQITGQVTRRQAEIRSGVNHDTIARMWRGDRVQEAQIIRFAIGYNVDPNPLLEAAGYSSLAPASINNETALDRAIEPSVADSLGNAAKYIRDLEAQVTGLQEQLAAKDAEIEAIKNAPLLDVEGNPFPRVILGFLSEFLEELATADPMVLSGCRVVMQNGLTRDQIRQWIARDQVEKAAREAEEARGYLPPAHVKPIEAEVIAGPSSPQRRKKTERLAVQPDELQLI